MYNKIISIICILISLFFLFPIIYHETGNNFAIVLAPSTISPNPDNIVLLQAASTESCTNLPNNLHAKSACLMDAGTGRILYNKNSDTPLPMASTTKIMTCIIALESGNPDSIVKVSKYASSMPDVQLNMTVGEEFRLNDLLYSLMLESHNDTAVAIAEHIGGNVQSFADMMNKKARELECKNTEFVTPNGLDLGNHHSTASDLCKIASYAISNPDFVSLINTKSHTFSNIAGSKKYTVYNHDSFLTLYNGAIGIKTGFTGKAGYCFVGAAKRDDITLVSAVLASGWPPNKAYKWNDTCKLMDYGFTNFKNTRLLNGNISLNAIPVKDSRNTCNSSNKELNLELIAYYSMLACDSDTAYLRIELPESVSAPVNKGDIIGYARLTVNNSIVKEYPITSTEDINEYTLSNYLSIIIDTFIPKM